MDSFVEGLLSAGSPLKLAGSYRDRGSALHMPRVGWIWPVMGGFLPLRHGGSHYDVLIYSPPTNVGLGGDSDEIVAIDDVERACDVKLDKARRGEGARSP